MAVGEKYKVGIVGVSGYAGLELVRILLRHPAVELTYLAGNHETDGPISHEFPHLLNRTSLPIKKYDLEACKQACDIVFVALPAGASGKIAAELWQEGLRVIDLSGDLRIPTDLYEKWYQKPALPGEIQQETVYGLPEWNKKQIVDATFISNPGCYPTAALLGLLPLFKADVVQQNSTIIVDAKSGVSGAGRAMKQNMQFGELSSNFYAYKVGRHQHTPEIEYQLGPSAYSKIIFTAHLLPIVRGIFSSMYVQLNKDIHADEAYELYSNAYQDAPFVQVLPYGQVPELKSVAGSNDCVLGIQFEERTGMLQVFSVIDNLQKGASGQAVQNMNIMLGLEETLSLDAIPFVP
jgi:N-acetyl-gamma-glutamyl-phosphate reductase